jgi:GNAT superfamily N-acetyltransferase
VSVEIKILGRGDEAVLSSVAPGVFDCDVEEHRSSEFLGDPRHHLAVVIEAGLVVGFASAVHYVHPDKSPELWVNEVGVAPTHRNRGLGKKLMRALFQVGRELGCCQAWVLTGRSNPSAMRLYASVGGIEASDEQVMFTFRLNERDPL